MAAVFGLSAAFRFSALAGATARGYSNLVAAIQPFGAGMILAGSSPLYARIGAVGVLAADAQGEGES